MAKRYILKFGSAGGNRSASPTIFRKRARAVEEAHRVGARTGKAVFLEDGRRRQMVVSGSVLGPRRKRRASKRRTSKPKRRTSRRSR